MRRRASFCCAVLASSCYSGSEPDQGQSPEPAAEPPIIESLTPDSGPFGTTVSITGAHLEEAVPLLGEEQAPVLANYGAVDAALIEFRFPFPYEGPVALDVRGQVLHAGTFTPTIAAGPGEPLSEPKLLHALSPEAGRIAAAFAGEPARLLESDGSSWSSRELALDGLDPNTLRLFLNQDAQIEALALSADGERRLVHLVADGNGLRASETEFVLAADHALGGGTRGGVAWSREADGWYRLRSATNGFVRDKGPIVEPAWLTAELDAAGSVHALGATGAGALHVLLAEIGHAPFDDYGYPSMYVVAPDAETFDYGGDAGAEVDDSIVAMTLESRGEGFLLHYQGVDVDTTGASSDENVYRMAAILPGGGAVTSLPESELAHFAIGRDRVGAAYCTADDEGETRLVLDPPEQAWRDDLDALPGEQATWPCKPVLAAEIDAQGALLVIVAHDDEIYSPRLREP